jgi:hypothetical protein
LALIPAFAAGLAAVILMLRGVRGVHAEMELYPGRFILWGGIAAYFILLASPSFCSGGMLRRELFLIVGWAMLALAVINALFGSGLFSRGTSLAFVFVIAAAAAASLVCYVLYYRLGDMAGYITGMAPLLAMAVFSAVLAIRMPL